MAIYARTTGYDPEDRDLVFEPFGRIPTDRGRIAQEIYDSVRGCSDFRLYSGIGHETSPGCSVT